MRTPSFLIVVSCCLLLLGACHTSPSSTSTHHSAADSSPRIDSPGSTTIRIDNPSLVARDSMPETPDDNYDTLSPATRSHFRDVQAFLDFIKRPNSNYNVGADEWIKDFHAGNIDSLLGFITVDSLEIDDADTDPGEDSLKYSRTMRAEKGSAAYKLYRLESYHISDL